MSKRTRRPSQLGLATAGVKPHPFGHLALTVSMLIAVAGLAGRPLQAAAPSTPAYAVTILSPETGNSTAVDLNDAGQALVAADDGETQRFYLYTAGEFEYLPGIDGQPATVRGINTSGVAVGTGETSGGQHALLWADGQVTDITVVPAPRGSWTTDCLANGETHR